MQTTTEIKACLTKKDVAQRLNVSEKTVNRLIDAGKLIGFYVGRVWRMKPENLERWMEAKTKQVS